MRNSSLIVLLSIVSFVASPVYGAPERSSLSVIPEQAALVAPHVFSLGAARDPGTGKIVEGIAIVHPKKENGHRSGHVRGGKGGTEESSCYAFLANDAKWKSTEPWTFNTANPSALDGSVLFTTIGGAIAEWEGVENKNIFGIGTPTNTTLSADETSPDDLNEVYFANLGNDGTIAVTIVWGIFGGPPRNRQLVEWDQVYNTHYAWSLSGEENKMDFENIAQHELGHALGLGHPELTCSDETMHRYADFGETIKRTLNAGDIAGIKALY